MIENKLDTKQLPVKITIGWPSNWDVYGILHSNFNNYSINKKNNMLFIDYDNINCTQ